MTFLINFVVAFGGLIARLWWIGSIRKTKKRKASPFVLGGYCPRCSWTGFWSMASPLLGDPELENFSGTISRWSWRCRDEVELISLWKTCYAFRMKNLCALPLPILQIFKKTKHPPKKIGEQDPRNYCNSLDFKRGYNQGFWLSTTRQSTVGKNGRHLLAH